MTIDTAQIQPATLAAASLVIQLCVLVISLVTLVVLMRSRLMRQSGQIAMVLWGVWALSAIFVVVVGEDFYATWGPILGTFTLPTISREGSFQAVFVLDIIFTSVLITGTGGAKRSPFTSVLLLLPTLAIFLREPAYRFLTYTALVAVLYVALLKVGHREWQYPQYAEGDFRSVSKQEEAVDNAATIWANIMCLMLATLIGYITRPIP